jgi:broad specificity phosphatase PhoE
LVRHAQASFGAANYDVLSQLGVAQAAALQGELEHRAIAVARVVVGSLVRQRDTVSPSAAAWGLEPIVDPRWDEYDADDILSVHSTSSARIERPRGSDRPAIGSRAFQDVLEEALLAWIAAGRDGPTREPWPVFAARAGAALRSAAEGLASGQTAVVCTSGGVLAAIAVALLGLPPAALVRFNRVAVNAGITRVASGRSGLTLVSFNEHGHLEPRGGPSLMTYR